jgi:hypothetical protein
MGNDSTEPSLPRPLPFEATNSQYTKLR